MITISSEAAERLKEQLVHRCFETGIGFRMLVNTGESGEVTFSIKLDRQHERDKVIESGGVKLFLDAPSASRVGKCQLDYSDKPKGGFALSRVQETKHGENSCEGIMPKAKV